MVLPVVRGRLEERPDLDGVGVKTGLMQGFSPEAVLLTEHAEEWFRVRWA